MRFLTISKHSEGHGGYERHRRMSRALIEAGHEVVWLAPGMNASVGEKFLPLTAAYKWIPGPLGWVVQLSANLVYYREQLKGVDVVFTTREYDAFGCGAINASGYINFARYRCGSTDTRNGN